MTSSGEWVYRERKQRSLDKEPAPFWSPSLTPSPQCVRLRASLPSPAWPNSPDSREGQRDAGTEKQEQGWCFFIFAIDKSPLALTVRLAFSNVSLCSGNVALATTLQLDLKVWIHIPAAELRKWFSSRA